MSPEDSLRLNVLLSQNPLAVRLDEGSLVMHALTDKGEASLPLHPTCRPDRYLRLVRETLSGHALGSPGGYPVFLSRWTRHGQMEGANLGQLLLIGEPEAVVAVVHSPALTDELARLAWWAMPGIEHARLMLARPAVARGGMGAVLAEYLVEHLPFLQEDHLAIMDTVAVLVGSGVLGAAQREAIWRRGRVQNSYYVAFLEHCPDDLPEAAATHPLCEEAGRLGPGAAPLQRPFGGQGQAFIGASLAILERPEIQEVVSRTLDAIGAYFTPVAAGLPGATAPPPSPALAVGLAAIRLLAGVSGRQVADVFARSSAIGSLMRRKIEPHVTPVRIALQALRHGSREGTPPRITSPAVG